MDGPSVTVGNTARHTQLIQLRVKQRHFRLVGCAVTYRVFTWSDRRTDNRADSCFVQTDVRPVAPTIARTIAATIASCKTLLEEGLGSFGQPLGNLRRPRNLQSERLQFRVAINL